MGTGNHWLRHATELRRSLRAEISLWTDVLARAYSPHEVAVIASHTEHEFIRLLPDLPRVGGRSNPLSSSLVESAQCLALYRAMRMLGATAAEVGRFLYDGVAAHPQYYAPRFSSGQSFTRERLMARRRERAAWSQLRLYPGAWVYEFVEGDGRTFDYGYDFTECASMSFYRAVGEERFLPFYCFADFPKCELAGLGLTRTMTLAEGHPKCDFRFREGGTSSWRWPPPFAGDGR